MSAKAILEYDGKRLLSKHLRDPNGKLEAHSLCAQVRAPPTSGPLPSGPIPAPRRACAS